MAKKIKTLLFSIVPLLLTLGIQLLGQFLLILIMAFFLSSTEETQDFGQLLTIILSDKFFMELFYILYSFCNILIFTLWYVKRCGGRLKIDIKKEVHPYELLGIAFLIPGTQYFSAILTSFISMLFPSWLEIYEEMLETAGIGENMTPLMLLYSVILAPIAEEIIFRGVTYKVARRAFPFWIANMIQALLFGVFHMNMLQGCYTFILGLFLGYVCEKGGSIYHAIFFHFLFNLWGTLLAQYLILDDPVFQGLIIIIGTVAGLFLGLTFFQKGQLQKLKTTLDFTETIQ